MPSGYLSFLPQGSGDRAATSAHLLIKRHGGDAAIHAAMRADELMEAGDMDGRAVWLRIVKAVEELLAKERPEGEKVH